MTKRQVREKPKPSSGFVLFGSDRPNETIESSFKVDLKEKPRHLVKQGLYRQPAALCCIAMKNPRTASHCIELLGIFDDPSEVEEFMDSNAGRTSLMRTARKRAWLCPHCIEEDLAFWGTSYWRRSHQLPGVMWCSKHRETLLHTHLSSMEAGPPDHCAQVDLIDTKPWSEGLQEHTDIQTYLEFCSNILEGGVLLEPSACKKAILNQAVAKGLHEPEVDNVEMILEQVPKTFPREWLAELDRRYVEIGRGGGSMARQYLRGINLNASMQIVALLIATVYSNADEALMDLTGSLRRPVEHK